MLETPAGPWHRSGTSHAAKAYLARVDLDAHVQLGNTVRLMRAGLRISQEELGDRAGLHRNYVGAIERGEINPTFKTLTKLADGFDVSLSHIVRAYEQRRASDASEGYRGLIGRGGEQIGR